MERQGRETGTVADKFRELRDKANKLLDVHTEDKTRKAVCEEKEFGVKLSDNRYERTKEDGVQEWG